MQLLNLIYTLQFTILAHKLFERIEVIRFYVVKNREKFFGIVLNRSPCEQEYLAARMRLQQLKCFSLVVFKSVSLIYYNVEERNILEYFLKILIKDFIGCYKNVEFANATLL